MPPSSPTVFRVLLIEDNPADCELIHLAVQEESDIKLIPVDTLSEAKEILRGIVVHVILMDLDLPDSRPEKTVEEIAPFAKSAPVIVLTGSAMPGIEAAANDNGAAAFLDKNRDLLRVASKIREVRQKWQLSRAMAKTREQMESRMVEFTRHRETEQNEDISFSDQSHQLLVRTQQPVADFMWQMLKSHENLSGRASLNDLRIARVEAEAEKTAKMVYKGNGEEAHAERIRNLEKFRAQIIWIVMSIPPVFGMFWAIWKFVWENWLSKRH